LGKPVEVDRALTDLMRRELIREKSQHPNRIYIFKHNLTQETAYRSLLLRKRRELHGLVGASLEQHDPERVTEIARHFNEAGERERALPYLVEAADRAARAYATAEAIAFYREALEILESVDNLALARRVYEGLGSALTFANEIPDAIGTYNSMLNLAKERDNVPMQVSALNKLSYVSALRLGQFQEAENYLAESDRLARKNEDKVGLSEHNLVRCMMCTAVADFEGVERYMGETVELGRELGVEEQRTMGLAHIASSQVFMLQFEEARETMQEGLALSRKIGDREHEAEILANTEPLYYWRGGDFEAARTSALEGIEIATKIGAMNLLAPACRMMGYLDFQQGKYESALEHFERYLEASRQAGIVWFEVEALCLLGSVQLEIDELHIDKVLAMHDQAERLMEQPGGIITGASAWIEVGTCALEIGKLEKAAELFQKGLTIPTATMNLERPRLIHGQALLAMENGDLEKAASLLRESRVIVEQHAIKPFYPFLALSEGKLQLMNGSFEAATERFESALSLAQEMGLGPLEWQAQVENAKALAARGQMSEAERAREQAQATIDELARRFTDPEMRRNYLAKVTADLAPEPGG
jgi:tetratricopeptide (TPR) repeat protein